MQLINMTPHEIKVGGLTIQPCGTVARVRELEMLMRHIQGPCMLCGDQATDQTAGTCRHQFSVIPVYQLENGETKSIPETLHQDTYYIVSKLVAQVARHPAVVCVTGFIRDSTGRITGGSGLAYYK